MAYGIQFFDNEHTLQMSNNSKNSRILFAGQGQPANPEDNAILLDLDVFAFDFTVSTGLILPRCAPVKYQFDNYTSNAKLNNTLNINSAYGTNNATNSGDANGYFDLAQILSQATDYDDSYLRVDKGDSFPTGSNNSNLTWAETRANFAPIVVYYG